MKNEEGDALGAVWGHGAEGEGGWRTGAGVGKMMLMGRKKADGEATQHLS